MKSRKLYNRVEVASQRQMALAVRNWLRKSRVNFQTVGYLEREEYNPSLDLAFRISEVFNLPVEKIFSTRELPPLSELIQ